MDCDKDPAETHSNNIKHPHSFKVGKGIYGKVLLPVKGS